MENEHRKSAYLLKAAQMRSVAGLRARASATQMEQKRIAAPELTRLSAGRLQRNVVDGAAHVTLTPAGGSAIFLSPSGAVIDTEGDGVGELVCRFRCKTASFSID